MNIFDWREFLRQWSQEILASMNDQLNQLPTDVIESGWLGYPGVSESDIIRTEARLQRKLPPSYREFLKVTNGWRQTTPFIHRMWSIEEVEWFSVRHRDWMEKFISEHNEFRQIHTHRNNGTSFYEEIPDSEYFIYGEQQDCSRLRIEHLRTALEISDKGESSIYLLNPQIVTDNGEWEAWFFGDWLPGADRYRSFEEMMRAEYSIFLELVDTSTENEDSEPLSTRYTATANRIQQWIVQANALGDNLSQDSRSDLTEEPGDDIPKAADPPDIPENAHRPAVSENESAEGSENTHWGSDQSFLITYQIRQAGSKAEARLRIQQAKTDASRSWPVSDIKQIPTWILAQIGKTDSASND